MAMMSDLPKPCPTCGAPTTEVYSSRPTLLEALDAIRERMTDGFGQLSRQLTELREDVEAAPTGSVDRLTDTIAAVATGRTPPGERWRDQER